MRVEFEDDDLRRLFEEPDFRIPRFHPELVTAFRKKVNFVQEAAKEQDLRAMRSLNFEPLRGKRRGQHSIRINRQWRIILRLRRAKDGTTVILIEITDYHD